MNIIVLYDEFFPLGLSLHRFYRIDELWNSTGVSKECLNKLWDFHGINGMNPRTKLGKMVKEFEGRKFRIERVQVF